MIQEDHSPRKDRVFAPALAELLTAFAVGAALMSFIYVDPRGGGPEQIGVPGFDSFYHTKMADMLPDVGLLREFPWLRFVYFSPTDDGFISHHYGFHVLIAPFVRAGAWLVGDTLAGGRWAITFFCGMNLLLFHALLIQGGVRWRWLWTVMFLLMPGDYFLRHSYVRAIAPSLMFAQLIILLMFQQRWRLTGLAIVGYCHLYLGSIVYTPVIVGLYVAAAMIAPRGQREIPWRLILWGAFGWFVGLRTYPYFDGALEFLRMQILGTGLNPDISVGSEWNSYGNVWRFAVAMCGPLLAAWGVALALRLGMGPRLDRRELTLVLLHFAFLVLTLKARRFIEYWPMFCLLSAAYLAAPVINPLAAWFDPTGPRAMPRSSVRVSNASPALRLGMAENSPMTSTPRSAPHPVRIEYVCCLAEKRNRPRTSGWSKSHTPTIPAKEAIRECERPLWRWARMVRRLAL